MPREPKLAESLKGIRVFNTHGLLTQFGDEEDITVEYLRSPSGLAGVGHPDRTEVWSVHPNKHLKPPTDFYETIHRKIFYGMRSKSLPQAKEFVADTLGITDLVPSPFGGYIPRHVLDKAKAAVKDLSGGE